MDPDACLDEIRALAAIVRDRCDLGEDPDVDGSAADLAARIEVMDVWLSEGGFLPEAWERKP